MRPDNLDALPFADTADQDPNALPFGTPDEHDEHDDDTPGCERCAYNASRVIL
jgi:hypothetical protein